jgi:hypothetical protein
VYSTSQHGTTQGETTAELKNETLYSKGPSPGSRFYQAPNSNSPYSEKVCFGCGKKGHGITSCHQLLKLIEGGKLTQMRTGQVKRPDGSLVKQRPEEMIVEALKHEGDGLVAHFIKVKANEALHNIKSVAALKKSKAAYIEEYVSSKNKIVPDDSGDNENTASTQDTSSDEENLVCPVERTMRNSRKAGFDRMEDSPMPIYPKLPKTSSEKRRERNDSPEIIEAPKRPKLMAENMPKNSPREQPSKDRVSENRHQSENLPEGVLVPERLKIALDVEAKHQPRVQPNTKRSETQKSVKERVRKERNKNNTGWTSEDIVEDEVLAVRKDLPAQHHPNTHRENSNTDWKNLTCRVSDVAAKVQPGKILDTKLRTPIKMEIGELLGSSRELSGLLSNAIKPKSVVNKIEAHSVWTKTWGLLIKVVMQCDGHTISAIIDTGSQLNIVSSYIWKTIIN